MGKRILILEFRQESNTFNPIVSDRSVFNDGGPTEGEDAFRRPMAFRSAVHGAVDAVMQAGGEPIPTVFMDAGSGGRVSDKVLEYLMKQVEFYAQNNAFDAVYASLHGATCTETNDDACGTLMEHLRRLAGDKPIAASFDLHANITEKVLKNTDIVCGYQTYPHRDFYQTGYRAGQLCMELLEGKSLSLTSASVPMLIPPRRVHLR